MRAELASKEADDGVRERDLAVGVFDIGPREAAGNHHERHVADHLGGGRHLHDVAEHAVDLGVGLGHLVPAFGEAQRVRLLAQVRELPARHLVQVDLGGRCAHVGLERGVLRAHHLPVVGDLPHMRGVETGVARLAAKRLHHRAQAGLGGEAREAVHREVHRIHARIHRREHAGCGDPGRVMGVEVHREPGFLLQRADQLAGRRRA